MPRQLLTDFELMILLATLRVGDRAYGVPIATEIGRTGGRQVVVAAVYAALDQAGAQRARVLEHRRTDARTRRPGQTVFSGHAAGYARRQGNPARAGRALEGYP